MRLALTGATGFVGRHFIRAAVHRGFEVVAFTRDPSRVVHDCVEVRGFTLDTVPNFRDCDAVVHLAGESIVGLWTSRKKKAVRESRIQGTRRVVEGIKALPHPPEVLVSASAIGLYADGADSELDERAPVGDGYLAQTCALWEAESAAAKDVTRVVNPRISNVLGRDGGMIRALKPLFRLGLGGRLGSGKQWMPWIHVDDLVGMMLFAVENLDVRGPLNAAAPWPVRNADFTRTLARTLHRPAFFHVPAFALRLLFRDFGRAMVASQRVVPAAALDAGYGFRFPELEPTLKDVLA